MKKMNNKGFSLVEILTAIAILAILMLVATQAYNRYKKQARQQAYDTMAKSATVAATNYLMENAKAKYITFDQLKELDYVDTLQDPRYKEEQCTGIVINKVIPGQENKQLDELFQKVKLCCKNYKYQYDYTGDKVVVTEIESCDYIEGDEIAGVYKLIYKTQGGTACDPAVVTKTQGETWGPLCETTKGKSIFREWNTKKNGSGSTITESTVVEDKDVNAYAIWTEIYTLTFNEDGGTACDPKSIDQEKGKKWGDLCETEKAGYAFKGWTTKKGGAGTKITKNSTSSKNITVYAHWNEKYTLTFDSNSGTECNPKTITKEKDEKWGDLCSPTRTGYKFEGWNTKKDGTGTKITKNSTATKNITVYAEWKPTYTLTFNSNGGTECNPKTITKEKDEKWGELCIPTRSGYIFEGWKNGTTTVTADSKATANITATAQWKSLHTLPIFSYTGKYQLVKDDDTIIASGTDSKVTIPAAYEYYTGNWKIRFLTSGTLTFHELRSATNGIDAFLVGGGGNGNLGFAHQAGRYGYAAGGGGGGGGYRLTKKGISVSTTSYSISIGGAQTKSTAFGYTANPGGTAEMTDGSLSECYYGPAGASGGAAGGRGEVNMCPPYNGEDGGCEFDDCSFSNNRYGGGGGGGHGHNGEVSSEHGYLQSVGVGTPGQGGAGGGGTGNNQYRGAETHHGQPNTGGGGGGGSYVYDKWDACGTLSNNSCNCWSVNGCHEVSTTSHYPAGIGGSGIVIIRNKR